MRTEVAIIGGGPSGLLLSQRLMQAGIGTVVLERQSRDHVLSRIRAGVLEWGTVEVLRAAGAGDRMDREGQIHDGCWLSSEGERFRIDFRAACGRSVMVYGQTEITRDLYAAQDAAGAVIVHRATDVALHDLDTDRPRVTWTEDGQPRELTCDYVAGCDGFHGVSRQAIPAAARTEYERVYPFGWLGILARTRPAADELIYAAHARGFALSSMRNPRLSRHYIQVPLSDGPEDWPDAAFWDELRRRLPAEVAAGLEIGPSIEKSVAPLRSFVCTPMQWGRLFLCGDAAHIVPPTGAKGLNLAVGDVVYLSEALIARYRSGDAGRLAGYSDRALARVWRAMRFSWSLTMLMHRFPDHDAWERRMQDAGLDDLQRSDAVRRVFAEAYTGLPF